MTVADLFFPREPHGVPGCEKCLTLVRKRHRARETRDLSAVSDCNVLLRRHLEEDH